MKELFFKDWQSLWHVAIATVISFVILFLFLRISGKRTLAKLNAFDFVVTVALGSTLAYMMLAMVPLLEGTMVLLLIIAMQYIFAKTARASGKMQRLVNSVPTLLYYNGDFIAAAMAKEAVTKEEVYAAIRQSGHEKLSSIRAVVMELNGSLTVVIKSGEKGFSSLQDIETDVF